MNPEIKKQWIDALRSGDYEQGKSALCQDGKYCCLGVLTDLAVKAGVVQVIDTDIFGTTHYGDDACAAYLPAEVSEWAGLDEPDNPHVYLDDDYVGLATLNDEYGYTFDEISYVIEAHL